MSTHPTIVRLRKRAQEHVNQFYADEPAFLAIFDQQKTAVRDYLETAGINPADPDQINGTIVGAALIADAFRTAADHGSLCEDDRRYVLAAIDMLVACLAT